MSETIAIQTDGDDADALRQHVLSAIETVYNPASQAPHSGELGRLFRVLNIDPEQRDGFTFEDHDPGTLTAMIHTHILADEQDMAPGGVTTLDSLPEDDIETAKENYKRLAHFLHYAPQMVDRLKSVDDDEQFYMEITAPAAAWFHDYLKREQTEQLDSIPMLTGRHEPGPTPTQRLTAQFDPDTTSKGTPHCD